MSLVAVPADRRFRRSHVKPSRTRRRWNRVVPLLRYLPAFLLVAYSGHAAWRGVAEARVLSVERVIVRGNEQLSEDEVLSVLGGLRGESLVWADLEGWRQQLRRVPWIKDAALRRALPSTVEIVVWERHPIGIGRLNKNMYLVDDQGTIIDQVGPEHAVLDLPIIDGLAVAGTVSAPAADPARAELAARVIDAFRAKPDIARRLSQVDVADLHNARVILTGDPAIISLGGELFLERLQSYLDLAPALQGRVERIDHVDVRFENRIYVRPASKQLRANGTRR